MNSFEPIAIVGRACLLPGASSPEELWEAVVEGRDLTSSVPADRWGVPHADIMCDGPADSADRTWSDRGGYVTGFDAQFDPEGFQIPADEISPLDPVVLWTLHTARQALLDAGRSVGDGSSGIGAVFGNLSFPSAGMAAFTEATTLRSADGYDEGSLTNEELAGAGLATSDPRNRFNSGLPALLLERSLGLGQGATALDAACASSLYAIKLACDRLHDGDAELMLAGAVNCADDLCIHLGFSALTALSRTGQSRPFHAEADGLVPAEGCGFVALRRLSDAVRDGDTIHGIIEGIGLSNDGRGRGFLVPSASGQARAMTAALDAAGVDPTDVSLLECHATGTTVGDATEIRSSAEVYGANVNLPIGSLKSNTGHLITAAGVAGLIKVTEAMRHEVRPPTNHVDEPLADIADSPFRLLTEPEPWDIDDTNGDVRRAGVSAFGFGGNNAHLIVSAPDAAAALLEAAAPVRSSAGRGAAPSVDGPVSTADASVSAPAVAIVGIGVTAASATGRHAFTDALRTNTPALNDEGEGRIDQIALDLARQKFPPNDLKKTLPQQLAMLAVADEALADTSTALPADRTGVYVGMGTDPEAARFGIRWRVPTRAAAWGGDDAWVTEARAGVGPVLDAPAVLGTMPNIVANRLNSQFDLAGPSFTVSSEEHSGLDALRVATRSLQVGEIDAAIVGAVDFSCGVVHQAAATVCLGSDRQTPGDAAVALVLKRLDDAERDGDRVYAVLPAENPEVVLAERADLLLGLSDRAQSVTDLLGHAHAASGLVHVAAAAVCLHHRFAPGDTPLLASNPASGSGLAAGAGPRSIAVEIEAMDGLAARNVVLAEASRHKAPARTAQAPRLHVFSAASPAQLVAELLNGAECSEVAPQQARVASARVVIVAADSAQLAERIGRAVQHIETGAPPGPGVHYRSTPIDGEMGFVFTAAGAAYHGMGAQLLAAMPELLDDVGETFPLSETGSWLYGDAEHAPSPDDFLWGTSLLTAAHASLSRGLLGLKPTAAIGYSSGESNSLFSFGVWSDRSAMRDEINASAMMSRELGVEFAAVARAWNEDVSTWAVWNVLAPVDEVKAAIADEARVHLAIVNTAADVVISGDANSCDRVVARLGSKRCRPVEYNLACHVPEIGLGFRQPWIDVHTRAVTPAPGVRFYSNGVNGAYDVSTARCAEVITRQAETTLDFPATIEAAYADGVRIFVEHGPAGACTNYISEILRGREFLAVHLDRRDKNIEQLFDAAAALVSAGVSVDHAALTERLSSSLGSASESPTTASPTTMTFACHPEPVRLPPRPSKESSRVVASEPTPPQALPIHTVALQVMPPAPMLPATTSLATAPLTNGVVLTDGVATENDAVEHAVEHTAEHAVAVQAPSGADHDALAHVHAEVAKLATLHAGFLHQRADLHAAFLRTQMAPGSAPTSTLIETNGALATPQPTPFEPAPAPAEPPQPTPTHDEPTAPQPANDAAPLWDKEQLKIHSSGRIADLFGEQFAPQESRTIQCRMPEPPLLLADRVMGIDATPGVLGTGTIWTETDVVTDAWYLNDGYMPTGFMIESGQADLMLISYMGIDLITDADRSYRLLGCTLTYHGDLPSPGDTLRYEIRITGHARHGNVRLFFFEYDCTVNGEKRLTVRDGQAGFFNAAELADALGVLWTPEQAAVDLNHDARVDPPTVIGRKSSFSASDVRAFSEGRIVECFGPEFDWTETHTRTPKIQAADQLFIDEVTHFDPVGGPWGRGFMRCETAMTPDAWFFDGHFKNDPCMPGNFMVEACVEAMSFYLAALGFTTRRDGWRFQPLNEQAFDLKCRGEINPQTKRVAYELHVQEVWDGPHPTVICDVLGFVDDKPAFHAHNIGVELVPSWPLTSLPHLVADTGKDKSVAVDHNGFAFDWKAMLSCAWGRPSEAFGSMYEKFDGVRRSPRLPGPPYHFISRIRKIEGELGVCQAGMEIVCEYDIPADAWYFDENGAETMPFAVLLEAALQPCGWVASAIGSASEGDSDMLFRNLDGTGTLTSELTRTADVSSADVLSTRVTITNVSRAGGMVIESFDVECFLGDRSVYVMDTVFGFFPPEAFESQVGMTILDEHRAPLELEAPPMVDLTERPDRFCAGAPKLANPMLLMLDRATHIPDAGRAGLGVLRGEKDVDITEWFFKAHFFQDPVQPGSLGIEALLQLLQFFMIDTEMGAELGGGMAGAHFEPIMLDAPLTWSYRGQVTPANDLITSTMEIIEVGTDERGPFVIGTGSLWCDGLRIYEVKNMGMRIVGDGPVEGAPPASGAVTEDAGVEPAEFDKTLARNTMSSYWHERRETPKSWLGDDLLDGLLDRYVRRIMQEQAGTIDRLRGRPALYVANHQVQLESLLISNLLPALTDVPMTTIANAKHEARWIGEMIRSLERYPGSQTLEQIVYFDQADPKAMFELLDNYRSRANAGPHSFFLHVDGTRSQSCRTPAQRFSSVFVDLALELDLPIVPIRFTGGLPVEPITGKAEFPFGHGRQDYWIGEPIEASELRALGLRERVERVVTSINGLGGSNETETPLEADPELAARTAAWQERSGIHEVYAGCWQVLSTCKVPSVETITLRDRATGAGANAPSGAPDNIQPPNAHAPLDEWLEAAAEMFLGSAVKPTTTPVRLDQTSHPHFIDHVVDESPVLPLAYVVELFARDAATTKESAGRYPVELTDVRVLNGLVMDGFSEGSSTELTLRSPPRAAMPGRGHERTLGDPGAARARYRCVVPADRLAEAPIQGLFPRATGATTADSSVYDDGGVLFHGPSFHVLSAVQITRAGVTALVDGVLERSWPNESWATDPALVDGLLQLALIWTEQLLGTPSLPTAIGSVRVWSPPVPGSLRATLIGVDSTPTRVRSNIVAVDETGAPMIELRAVDTYPLLLPSDR